MCVSVCSTPGDLVPDMDLFTGLSFFSPDYKGTSNRMQGQKILMGLALLTSRGRQQLARGGT